MPVDGPRPPEFVGPLGLEARRDSWLQDASPNLIKVDLPYFVGILVVEGSFACPIGHSDEKSPHEVTRIHLLLLTGAQQLCSPTRGS